MRIRFLGVTAGLMAACLSNIFPSAARADFPETSLVSHMAEGDTCQGYVDTHCACGHEKSFCPDCDDCWTNLWDVYLGVMFLDRGDTKAKTLVTTLAGAERINAANFDFETEAGVEAQVGRRLNDIWTARFRYFGNESWNAEQISPAASYRIAVVAPAGILSGGLLPATVTGTYGTDFHSEEFNFVRNTGGYMDLLVGFRALQLYETLRLDPTPFAAGFAARYSGTTDNELIGVQVGTNFYAPGSWGRWTVDGSLKAGAYENSADYSALLERPLGNLTASGTSDDVAFVGEFILAANAALTNNLDFRVAYELIGLDGLALAGNQVDATNFTTGTGIHDSGSALFQGVSVGFTYLR